MITDQIQGLRQQLTGLIVQGYGAILGNEYCVLKGRTLRMRGYLRTRLGPATQSCHRRMRQLRLNRAVQQ